MGNTKILCTVYGPTDPSVSKARTGGAAGGRGGGGGGTGTGGERCEVRVEISIAAFAGTDRKRYGRGDK